MPLETKPFVVADYLHDEEDLAGYLAVVLEEAEYPTLFSAAIEDAAKARGGLAVLAKESGVPEAELQQAVVAGNVSARPTVTKLQAAYHKRVSQRLVA